MLKHNLLIAIRNFRRHKSSFLINLVGLSAGLACTILVYLWVSDEMGMDKFHENEANLYQVLRNTTDADDNIITHENNSDLMLAALENEVPEIEHVTAVIDLVSTSVLENEDKKFKASGLIASEDYFDVFSYNLISGNKKTALKAANSIVLSKKMAENFFGIGNDAVGKPINFKHAEEEIDALFTVSGVFEIPPNSSANFDFLLTYNAYLLMRDPKYIHWGSNSSEVYVTLNPGVNLNAFNTKIADFIKRKDENNKAEVFLSSYSDKYLNGRFENGIQAGGRIDYVILFSIIALFVLAIACINFMNLSTARASRRLKEVGIKKAVGASRKSLIFQYLTEALLLSFFALICSILLSWALLPWFNDVTGKKLSLNIGWEMLVSVLAISFITGLLAGSYPALYLSKFKPATILKGKLNTTFGELFTRKGLVVFQFSLSILLIVGVGIIYKQLDFLQSKNLGYDKDNVLIFEREGNLVNNMDTFLAEAKRFPGVLNTSYIQGSMTDFDNSSSNHSWPGQTEEQKPTVFWHAHVGQGLIETMGIEMAAGRSYVNEFSNYESKIILNETAIEAMGLSDPIGTVINMRGANREIIGVVKDFHIQSLYEDIKPMALLCKTQWVNTLVVKVKGGSEKATIGQLTTLYADFNPGLPFDFKFLDEQYQALYVSEQKVGSLSGYFAGLAILISCLGLFGLAAFTAERRQKEIGVRKILGASVFGIIKMLSADFTKMVLISIIIALPVSYYLAGNWLNGFAYSIDLEWWFFAGAGLLALLIAWATVGFQTIKAARTNPLEFIKNE